MKPAKCRTCGVAEWRHVCGGAPEAKALVAKRVADVTEMPLPWPQTDDGVPGLVTVDSFNVEPHVENGVAYGSHVIIQEFPVVEKPKRGRPKTQTPEQRKEYLKHKAKERRDRLKIV